MKANFRDPWSAYAVLDFSGRGFITKSDFFRCREVNLLQSKYTREDIEAWFARDDIFKNTKQGEPESRIDFTQFKKYFFPQLMQIHDNEDIKGTPGDQWER